MQRVIHSKRRASGFTLIEVMVVVVILGILAAIVVPRIMDRPDEARITKARQDIRALEAALNLYRLDNYAYPTTDQVSRRWPRSRCRNLRAGRRAAISIVCRWTLGSIPTST